LPGLSSERLQKAMRPVHPAHSPGGGRDLGGEI